MTENAVRPALIVNFDDEVGTFPAQETANQALLVQHVDNIYGGGYAAVKALIVLTTDMVLPDEQEEFGEFLMRNGRHPDFQQRLYDGLEACWKGETTLPLERSEDSSETSSAQDGDQSSKDDSSSPDIPAEESLPEVA